MKQLSSEFFIVSVYESSKAATINSLSHNNMLCTLDMLSVPYQSIVGAYKNIEEESILIPIQYERIVQMIARDHNQESYLKHNNDRSCELIYSNGYIEKIGTMVEVSENKARSKNAWSRGVDGRFFIVE